MVATVPYKRPQLDLPVKDELENENVDLSSKMSINFQLKPSYAS